MKKYKKIYYIMLAVIGRSCRKIKDERESERLSVWKCYFLRSFSASSVRYLFRRAFCFLTAFHRFGESWAERKRRGIRVLMCCWRCHKYLILSHSFRKDALYLLPCFVALIVCMCVFPVLVSEMNFHKTWERFQYFLVSPRQSDSSRSHKLATYIKAA